MNEGFKKYLLSKKKATPAKSDAPVAKKGATSAVIGKKAKPTPAEAEAALKARYSKK